MRARIYHPGPLQREHDTRLDERASHHVVRVLRLAPGVTLTLFDGEGAEFECRLVSANKQGASVRMLSRSEIDRESTLRVTLAQGISTGDRMDFTIQKAVELGVDAIQPLSTERTRVKLAADRVERRLEHWRNVAIAACEQCGRNRLPEIHPPREYYEWLFACPPDLLRIVLAPDAESRLSELARPAGPVVLLAGPESGLTGEESRIARTRGFVAARLGPRVLRTETVSLAALAAMQALWGDF